MSDPTLPEPEDLYVVYEDDGAPDPDADAPLIDAPRYVRTEVAPYHEELPEMWAAVRAGRTGKVKIDPGGRGRITWASNHYADEVPRAAASLFKRLQAAGWDVRMRATKVRVDPLLYVGSSAAHDAGDVRTPGHLRRYWFIQAVLVKQDVKLAWFTASWEKRELGPKPGNKFEDAITWDITGGKFYEPSSTAFDEWVSIFAPKPPPKPRKKKADAHPAGD